MSTEADTALQMMQRLTHRGLTVTCARCGQVVKEPVELEVIHSLRVVAFNVKHHGEEEMAAVSFTYLMAGYTEVKVNAFTQVSAIISNAVNQSRPNKPEPTTEIKRHYEL